MLSRIELQSADSNGCPSLHCYIDGRRQGLLPRLKELRFDCLVLDDTSLRNLLPCARVADHGFAEFVVCRHGRALQSRSRVGCRPTERMRKRLMLLRGRCNGSRCGNIRTFQVCGCKVCDAVSDSGAKFCKRLLNSGGIVIGL